MKRKSFKDYKRYPAVPLRMGKPNKCYQNAMTVVFQYPQRLKYLEGFEIPSSCTEPTCRCYGLVRFVHHARVLDVVTGVVHEVTPGHQDSQNEPYVYKEFTRDELKDIVGDPLTSPKWWTQQLTYADQFKMLTEAGYDVELIATTIPDYEGPYEEELVDMSKLDMDIASEERCYLLNEEKGTKDKWGYEWRIKEPATAPAVVEAQAEAATA